MNNYPSYSVAIRTLGTAGEKYQETLNSIARQSIAPQKVFVYIPNGYKLPTETIGIEEYIRCDKGMVTQRSLPFNEITSEYILFLDDDLSFQNDFVKKLFDGLLSYSGDCISPNIYPHHQEKFINKVRDFFGGTHPHFRKDWAFLIRKDNHYSYNYKPQKDVLLTQSGAGACCLCKKKAFQAIHFEDEKWLEETGYAFGDDQVFFYKFYVYGFKVLTSFNAKVTHLDAGASTSGGNQMQYKASFCDYITWKRTVYQLQKSKFQHFNCVISLICANIISLPLYLLIAIKYRSINIFTEKIRGILDAEKFLKSEAYTKYPSFTEHLK